jgi:chemotaxis protein MotA
MEITSTLGLLASFALVGAAISYGGHAQGFIDPPSMLIVFGGTLSVLLTSFSAGDVFKAFATCNRALVAETPNFNQLAKRLLQTAQKARQSGLLAIQPEARGDPNLFLRQALSLAVDGAPAEVIETILYHDTANLMERHERTLMVLRRGAEVSPAMGLIGTLIGLAQMLASLSNPAAVGPAMAVAILTTFYGAMLAYMVLTPLATKLERTGHEDLLTRKLITTTAISIVKQENPRQLELHLNSLLPPAHRVAIFK